MIKAQVLRNIFKLFIFSIPIVVLEIKSTLVLLELFSPHLLWSHFFLASDKKFLNHQWELF